MSSPSTSTTMSVPTRSVPVKLASGKGSLGSQRVRNTSFPPKASQLSRTPVKTSARKITQSVDSNLNAYSRTDPFLAINTLIKLFSSLSSRIGGCQYKLSPLEHTLSLHLLNIVEPFVGLAPSRRSTLNSQPTEILDSIIVHLDSPRDLLALSLSCRRIHDIVSPRHLDYRLIRCKVSSTSVWNHLRVHRALARNVRRLEILDERAPMCNMAIPPGILESDTDLESTDDELEMHQKHERFLVNALDKMTSLKEFVWSCNHSPISVESLWPTLIKCSSLSQIEINDNLIFGPHDQEEPSQTRRKVGMLPELKGAVLRSTNHTYGSSANPELLRVSAMLHHCPNLESLDITYNTPRGVNSPMFPVADDLLLTSRWPSLTTLVLTNLRASHLTCLTPFLNSHPTLESLQLDISNPGTSRLNLEHDALPRLRVLSAPRDVATAILAVDAPIHTLRGVRLDGDSAFLAALRGHGERMRRIELKGYSDLEDIRRLVGTAPRLTWLDVGVNNQSTHRKGCASEWATVLSGFSDLAAFHGVRLFHEVAAPAVGGIPPSGSSARNAALANVGAGDRSRLRKNDEVAAVLAGKCVKLRRVDHWDDDVGKVIVLVRDGGEGGTNMGERVKVKWEVRKVKL